MNKTFTIIFTIFVVFSFSAIAQDSVKITRDSTQPCLLTKVNLSVVGKLKLGSNLSDLKTEYPELRATESSPIQNTTAYLTNSPFSNISHILLVFSSENKLVSFTLVYSSQKWTSIETAFNEATNSLRITVPKNSLTVWLEGKKDTITVDCKDFAIISTLNPIKVESINSVQLKRFTFTISDKSVINNFTENTQTQDKSKNKTENNSKIFPQYEAEYSIEFPKTPTIKTVQSEIGAVEQATFVSDDRSVFRAEYGVATVQQLSAIVNASEEELKQTGIKIGRMVGYTGVTVTSGKTNLGTYIQLRGYKVINGTSYLIEHLMYYGKRSSMSIVTGSKATDYPTTDIKNFINSLKRKFE